VRGLHDGGGGHLLGVADDNGGVAAPHRADRLGDPDLGGFVEDDQVEAGGVGCQERGCGRRADQDAWGEREHDVRVCGEQLPERAAAALAQLGAEVGEPPVPVVRGERTPADEGRGQVLRQRLAQPVGRRPEGLDLGLVGGGIEVLHAAGAAALGQRGSRDASVVSLFHGGSVEPPVEELVGALAEPGGAQAVEVGEVGEEGCPALHREQPLVIGVGVPGGAVALPGGEPVRPACPGAQLVVRAVQGGAPATPGGKCVLQQGDLLGCDTLGHGAPGRGQGGA
jgi:hypothetical protein